AGPAGVVAADLVDQPPVRRGDQPGPGIFGYAVGPPPHVGREQRLLHGVLALLELAVPAHEHAEDLRRQLAQQVLGRSVDGHNSSSPPENMTWRTSMPRPSNFASGICAASSMARSLFSQSTR